MAGATGKGKREAAAANSNRFVTARVLQQTARAMLPFYKRIATDRSFALQWTLLRQVGLTSRVFSSLATNGIGYFVDFPAPKPIEVYTNGTSLRPGTTQFYFNTAVHRSIARAVLPLYRELSHSRSFALLVAGAIRGSNRTLLNRLVRSLVGTKALRTVGIFESGFQLGFKYPQSQFTFYNQTFRELTG
ncbi:hypothetical protein O9H85_19185 [Paenibacillus filicis]|uniref:Coat protein n=1 Tax=Paenibacillus gyeongsangnamensis TaxID=3388067 RepID=A0ABT4QCJ4_9BACL|nr:hypothetical protein [Paenibacillus filicis]MCZ8514506.1 hypothetical protein [Paenibacillus filicis]